MTNPTAVTVAAGDGIGPEIMTAVLTILEAAGAHLAIEMVRVGEHVYLAGGDNGLDPHVWDSLRRTRVFLKGPITTPQGGGYKSVNVTLRKALGMYANVRPSVSYHPFISTRHPAMDVVIIRENEEDLYAGIEHRQTVQVYQCLKLITRPGSEKIIQYAFDYARAHGRHKVTCLVKDNIMKMTDGLFHQVFDEIALHYPDIENEMWIVDIGAAKLADTPEFFDVLVMPNLYGDVLSDVTAQIAGSVGLAGSANIGDQCAMFEAIHGSAPRIAGQNRANPSGLLQASVMMLTHIGQPAVASRIHNAWLKTIEDGIHTDDIFTESVSRQRVSTTEFTAAVLVRIGETPRVLNPVTYHTALPATLWTPPPERLPITKKLVGVDVFLDWDNGSPNELGPIVSRASVDPLRLRVITNRGVKVWPDGFPETFCTDHWRCRFLADKDDVYPGHITQLLDRIAENGLESIKTENLYLFDGVPGFAAVHG